MGQYASTEEDVLKTVEDMVWNEDFLINTKTVMTGLDGKCITTPVMESVCDKLSEIQKEHQKKTMFFLEKNCLSMSNFHAKMDQRYYSMRFTLLCLFIYKF